jgi:hypothetical protein
MRFARVNKSTLSIQGIYEALAPEDPSELIVSAQVHPDLELNAIMAVLKNGVVHIVAEPKEKTLDDLKLIAAKRLDDETREYIYSRYNQERQTSLIAFALFALAQNMMNRFAKVGEVMAWIESVLSYHYAKVDAINAATTAEELSLVTWDFETLTASDPDVWIAHIIAIND